MKTDVVPNAGKVQVSRKNPSWLYGGYSENHIQFELTLLAMGPMGVGGFQISFAEALVSRTNMSRDLQLRWMSIPKFAIGKPTKRRSASSRPLGTSTRVWRRFETSSRKQNPPSPTFNSCTMCKVCIYRYIRYAMHVRCVCRDHLPHQMMC